jgi:hypothetical protein
LTKRPRDLTHGGNEKLTHLKQVVLKPPNLQEQVYVSTNGSPKKGSMTIPNYFNEIYMTNLFAGTMVKAIYRCGITKGITVEEFMENDAQVRYKEVLYDLRKKELQSQMVK